LFFNEFKNILGGKVRFIVTGSAPTEPTVKDFLKATLCSTIVDGYGMTETCGGGVVN
jgi:long-chain acyl-CoA synthetase